MPTILITSEPPGELFSRSVDKARRARDAIDALTNAPPAAGESPQDRFMRMANQAIVLAEAFTIIDTLLSGVAAEEFDRDSEDDEPCDCHACVRQSEDAAAGLNMN
jgi:hypothetical protein